MLTISVKNFGPIAEGSVDLKPLTIFVGPSNTGKSYMATAVYAVTSPDSSVSRLNLLNRHNAALRRSAIEDDVVKTEEFKEAAKSLLELMRQRARNEFHLSELTFGGLPPNIRLWLERLTLQQLEFFQRQVVKQICLIHGEASEYISRGSKPEDFRFLIRRSSPKLHLEIQLSDVRKVAPVFDVSQTVIPEPAFEMLPYFHGLDEDDDQYGEISKEIASDLVQWSSARALNGLMLQRYYLPAARSGTVQSHKVLSAVLVGQSLLIGIERLNIPTLSAITTEFLSYLIGLDRRMARQDRNSELDNAISFIETEVLRGRIDLDESVGLPYPEIVYAPVGIDPSQGKFTLDHTSSMVSELAPLILFLKYLVRPGDLLILEEPESHLHPAAQRQLARGIVRLVNAGVRVLITTHSDIIISQVNNLLALRQASEELIKQGDFVPEDFLQPDQVGAYLFRYSQELGGCETVALEIDPETGIDEDEFATVFEAIYDESIALQRDRN